MNEIFHECGNDVPVAKTQGSSELLVISNESCNSAGMTKDLPLPPVHSFINLENSFIITSVKESHGIIAGKLLSFESGKQNIVKLLEPPPSKKLKQDTEGKLKEMLFSLQGAVLTRLDAIEKKVDRISCKCQCVEEKVENALLKAAKIGLNYEVPRKGRLRQVVLGMPVETSNETKAYSQLNSLNCEEAYPDGSWLGNPDNPNCRVRCDISQKDLISINESSATPEKMALTLLDYLFDRETQACSNISGSSKHGKLQLDPLRIFGIRCHLTHMFGITEQQWHRIKLNIDSKCRTAFRRKLRGMPLTVKGFREKSSCETHGIQMKENENCTQDTDAAVHLVEVNRRENRSCVPFTDDHLENSTDAVNEQKQLKPERPNKDTYRRHSHSCEDIHATLEQ